MHCVYVKEYPRNIRNPCRPSEASSDLASRANSRQSTEHRAHTEHRASRVSQGLCSIEARNLHTKRRRKKTLVSVFTWRGEDEARSRTQGCRPWRCAVWWTPQPPTHTLHTHTQQTQTPGSSQASSGIRDCARLLKKTNADFQST